MTDQRSRSALKKLSSVIGFVLFGAATWVIAQEVRRVGWAALRRDFLSIPRGPLALALLLTPLAYLLLTTYDVLAFRYIAHRLERRKIMFAAFLGYAFSNSISMTPSMAVRYRLYSYWGLTGAEISKVIFFHYLSTWLGFIAVAGAIFLIEPTPISSSPYLTFQERRWIGLALLLLLLAYFLAGKWLKNGIRIKNVEFRPPAISILTSQIVVATLDWSLVAVIPYVLLPVSYHLPYLSFLSVFLLAQIIQIVSHVPGGIGVFEGTMLLLLKSNLPSSAILASLLVYRAIYTLLPLVIAAPALLIFEIKHDIGRKKVREQA